MAEGKKWLTYGCLGCLGLVALLVFVGAVLAGLAWRQVGQEEVKRHVSTPERRVAEPEPRASPQELDRPGETGHVVLELRRGEFEIEPLPPGEALRVEGRYDENTYELTESFERGEGGDWTYRLHFDSKVSNVVHGLRQLFGGSQPELSIYLPSDLPVRLAVDLSQGGGRVDLGGMWLTEVDLQVRQGAFRIDVDEPLRQPAERISIRGSMGGMQISRLGNASPRRLDVDFGMGGLELDLRGEWATDSEIRLSSRMGGTVLRLPRDVIVEGLDAGGFSPPSDAEIPPPTLRFDTSNRMGEIEIVR